MTDSARQGHKEIWVQLGKSVADQYPQWYSW